MPSATIPTALALSPHLDDAVFSCGGLIASLADAGWNVVVATVFTRSVPNPQGFALACQLDKGLAPEDDYMALRRAEDAAACSLLGATPRWLDFAEAPHRGYHTVDSLFGSPHPGDEVDASLLPALGGLVEELKPDLVLAPQCVGGHVDHVVMGQTLRSLEPAAPILWWRDFPYDMRPGVAAEPFGRLLDGLPQRHARFAAAWKQRACAAYTTQIGYQFGDEDGLARMIAAGGGVERFRLQGRIAEIYPLEPSS